GSLAWQKLEANFGRGLLDDLTMRQARNLSSEELKREQELSGRLRQVELQLAALHTRSRAMHSCAEDCLAGQMMSALVSGKAGVSAPANVILQCTFALSWRHSETVEALLNQRLSVQAEYSRLEQELAHEHGVAAGQVYDLARIQAQLPAEAA